MEAAKVPIEERPPTSWWRPTGRRRTVPT